VPTHARPQLEVPLRRASHDPSLTIHLFLFFTVTVVGGWLRRRCQQCWAFSMSTRWGWMRLVPEMSSASSTQFNLSHSSARPAHHRYPPMRLLYPLRKVRRAHRKVHQERTSLSSAGVSVSPSCDASRSAARHLAGANALACRI
jgi:hypothetical protein